jgi:ribonuclease HI
MKNKVVQIFSDGAASPNPGVGGWGAILIYGKHRKEISEGFVKSTNNRMELIGVLRGLEALKKEGLDIEITSDSKYVVDSINKGWVFNWEKSGYKDRKNADLWKKFLILYRKHKVKMIWVRGHNEHPLNEQCDRLAVAARKGNNLKIDTGYVQ